MNLSSVYLNSFVLLLSKLYHLYILICLCCISCCECCAGAVWSICSRCGRISNIIGSLSFTLCYPCYVCVILEVACLIIQDFALICAVDDWRITTTGGHVTMEGWQLQLDLITILAYTTFVVGIITFSSYF